MTTTTDVQTRKMFTGKVVSVSRNKTIAVSVETYVKHPIYHKRFRKIKKFHAHDEHGKAKLNDIVSITETRPISKTKTFKLVEILETAKDGE